MLEGLSQQAASSSAFCFTIIQHRGQKTGGACFLQGSWKLDTSSKGSPLH